MKVHAATSPSVPEQVLVSMDPGEAQQLADDLRAAERVLELEGTLSYAPARVARLGKLRSMIELALAREPTPPVSPPEPATVAVDHDHLEWVVRVFRATPAGVQGTMAISRPFPTEARARDFFQRTTAVHRAKVLNGEAPAYEVVLGTQDDRKWRKDRNFTVIDRQLVTGS